MNLVSLGDICSYRNESISAKDIDSSSYVSTDSMLTDKRGIGAATSTPSSGKVKRFYKGDTLVSNIRPYFKKIWHAAFDGTCSGDVLVFSPTNCNSEFLYWVLSEDRFFDYASATSKGTKMPRGDKTAIMNYQVLDFDTNAQRAICSFFHPIQSKIALNNRINDYLANL